VAAGLREEVFGEDCHLDAATETAAGHAVGELGWVVLFGVAGEFGHVGCMVDVMGKVGCGSGLGGMVLVCLVVSWCPTLYPACTFGYIAGARRYDL
jgi:hypothetical protein